MSRLARWKFLMISDISRENCYEQSKYQTPYYLDELTNLLHQLFSIEHNIKIDIIQLKCVSDGMNYRDFVLLFLYPGL